MSINGKHLKYGIPLVTNIINGLTIELNAFDNRSIQVLNKELLIKDIDFFKALLNHLNELQEHELKK